MSFGDHVAAMFLRPHHRDKDGKRHTYWSLVETVRTTDGPRQRTLCHLGELNDSAQARRVWVFDRGIVSDANLAAIRRRGGQYLVGTRRTTLRHVEQALLDGPWTTVRDEVEAQLIPIPGGTESYVLCGSTARREKELAIRRRFSTRLEDRLRGLEQRVATGRLKDRAKIERLVGRLQASYASVADLDEMAVRDEDGQPRLHWTLIEDRRAWRDAREGAYWLRTNLLVAFLGYAPSG